jgi:hypothetical protein
MKNNAGEKTNDFFDTFVPFILTAKNQVNNEQLIYQLSVYEIACHTS